jgi:hypothetical protein
LRRDLVTCEVGALCTSALLTARSINPSLRLTCKRTNHSCHCPRYLDLIKPRDRYNIRSCYGWTTSFLSQAHLCSLDFADFLPEQLCAFAAKSRRTLRTMERGKSIEEQHIPKRHSLKVKTIRQTDRTSPSLYTLHTYMYRMITGVIFSDRSGGYFLRDYS